MYTFFFPLTEVLHIPVVSPFQMKQTLADEEIQQLHFIFLGHLSFIEEKKKDLENMVRDVGLKNID
jgi:hypothetical protein